MLYSKLLIILIVLLSFLRAEITLNERDSVIINSNIPTDLKYGYYFDKFSAQKLKLFSNLDMSNYLNKYLYVGYGTYDKNNNYCKYLDVDYNKNNFKTYFTHIIVNNNKTYAISTSKWDLEEAKELVRKFNGYIVAPNSIFLNNYLYNEFDKKDYWIGLFKESCADKFKNHLNITPQYINLSYTQNICQDNKLGIYQPENHNLWYYEYPNNKHYVLIEIDSPDYKRPIRVCSPWWRIERAYNKEIENDSYARLSKTFNVLKYQFPPKKTRLCVKYKDYEINNTHYTTTCKKYFDIQADPICSTDLYNSICQIDTCVGYIKNNCNLLKQWTPFKDYVYTYVKDEETGITKKIKTIDKIVNYDYDCPPQPPSMDSCELSQEVLVYPTECPNSKCSELINCLKTGESEENCLEQYSCEMQYGSIDNQDIDENGNVVGLYGKCSDGSIVEANVDILKKVISKCLEYETIHEVNTTQKECEAISSSSIVEVPANITEKDVYQENNSCIRINNLVDSRPAEDLTLLISQPGNMKTVISYQYIDNYSSNDTITDNNDYIYFNDNSKLVNLYITNGVNTIENSQEIDVSITNNDIGVFNENWWDKKAFPFIRNSYYDVSNEYSEQYGDILALEYFKEENNLTIARCKDHNSFYINGKGCFKINHNFNPNLLMGSLGTMQIIGTNNYTLQMLYKYSDFGLENICKTDKAIYLRDEGICQVDDLCDGNIKCEDRTNEDGSPKPIIRDKICDDGELLIDGICYYDTNRDGHLNSDDIKVFGYSYYQATINATEFENDDYGTNINDNTSKKVNINDTITTIRDSDVITTIERNDTETNINGIISNKSDIEVVINNNGSVTTSYNDTTIDKDILNEEIKVNSNLLPNNDGFILIDKEEQGDITTTRYFKRITTINGDIITILDINRTFINKVIDEENNKANEIIYIESNRTIVKEDDNGTYNILSDTIVNQKAIFDRNRTINNSYAESSIVDGEEKTTTIHKETTNINDYYKSTYIDNNGNESSSSRIRTMNIINTKTEIVYNNDDKFGLFITSNLNYPAKISFEYKAKNAHFGAKIEKYGYLQWSKLVNADDSIIEWTDNSKTNFKVIDSFMTEKDGEWKTESNIGNYIGDNFYVFLRDGSEIMNSEDYLKIKFYPQTYNDKLNKPFEWSKLEGKDPVYCPDDTYTDDGDHYCHKPTHCPTGYSSIGDTQQCLTDELHCADNGYEYNTTTMRCEKEANISLCTGYNILDDGFCKSNNQDLEILPNYKYTYVLFNTAINENIESFKDSVDGTLLTDKLTKLFYDINFNFYDKAVNRWFTNFTHLEGNIEWGMLNLLLTNQKTEPDIVNMIDTKEGVVINNPNLVATIYRFDSNVTKEECREYAKELDDSFWVYNTQEDVLNGIVDNNLSQYFINLEMNKYIGCTIVLGLEITKYADINTSEFGNTDNLNIITINTNGYNKIFAIQNYLEGNITSGYSLDTRREWFSTFTMPPLVSPKIVDVETDSILMPISEYPYVMDTLHYTATIKQKTIRTKTTPPTINQYSYERDIWAKIFIDEYNSGEFNLNDFIDDILNMTTGYLSNVSSLTNIPKIFLANTADTITYIFNLFHSSKTFADYRIDWEISKDYFYHNYSNELLPEKRHIELNDNFNDHIEYEKQSYETGMTSGDDINQKISNYYNYKYFSLLALGLSDDVISDLKDDWENGIRINYPSCKWYEACNNHTNDETKTISKTFEKKVTTGWSNSVNDLTIYVPYIGDYILNAYDQYGNLLATKTIYARNFISSGTKYSYQRVQFATANNFNIDYTIQDGNTTNACRYSTEVEWGGGVSGANYEIHTPEGYMCAKSNDLYVREHSATKITIQPTNFTHSFNIELIKPMPFANRIIVITGGKLENREYRCYQENNCSIQ